MPVAAIGAATSLIGGIAGASGASKAAQAQGAASQATIGANQQLLGQIGSDVNPTIGYGNAAGNELAGLLGIGGNAKDSANAFNTFRNSTNYRFMLNQGEQGQAFLNAPNLNSGATAKALGNYAQGMAGNALSGYEGLLTGEQGLGLQGSNIFANAGTNLAAQNANARNLAAGAQGTSDLYGANALSGALGSIGNLAGSSFGASPFGAPNAFSGFGQAPGAGSPGVNGFSGQGYNILGFGG